MIVGIGTDLLQLERIDKALKRTPKLADRILTPAELQQFKDSSQGGRFLAKRFAAKEAVVKALGTGIGNGVGWQHIEISKDQLGKPLITLSGGALLRADSLGVKNSFLSYSDERDYIVAMVVLER
ncbi:MAG: holo-(acyl-carrier protein) synthase [Osedax symbiont Rs2]|nr:MAG: holo-(acyl-carrier protein) synthase [Osedax symbiont Rs2]